MESRIRKLQNRGIFNEDFDEHHVLKEAYAFLFGSPEAFLQKEKWRYLLRDMLISKQLTFAIVADENILANTHIDPGQVGQKIPLLTTRVETLAADKHVIGKLPLVPFWIIKLTRLTAGVCMKVRFKSKVTRGFSFSPLRDSCSPLRGSLAAPTKTMKTKKNLWDQGNHECSLCQVSKKVW